MNVKRLTTASTALVVVDFQERFRGAVFGFDEAAARAAILVSAARLLNIHTVVSEQYPKGLGHTVEPLASVLGDAEILEKTVFPASRAEGFDLNGSSQVILSGVEAHVCVAQTALDLLDSGLEVFIPADAVASRNELDRDIAIERLRNSGAVITTVEAVVFELAGGAGHPLFKDLQGLIK